MVYEGVIYIVGVLFEYVVLICFGGEGLRKCMIWKLVVSGGEKLMWNYLDVFVFLGLIDLRLVNVYGLVEGIVLCIRMFVDYCCKDWDEDFDVGIVMLNYIVVIVNDKLELVLEGFLGEICIGGVGVVVGGYVIRLNELVIRFIIDFLFVLEFSMRDIRFYCMGDLGWFLFDGLF